MSAAHRGTEKLNRAGGRWVGVVVLLAACAVPPGTAAPGPGGGMDALPPPGYGTLRQDEVTVSLMADAVQLKVTPLAESVIVVTAPDTYRRLAGLTEAYGPEPGSVAAPESLFLVSFFSDEPDVGFVPEDVYLLARGLRVRHTRIAPVTPGWGQRRLGQRETQMAVYAFPPVDLESDLTVVYGLEQARTWASILLLVQAERSRARARAGG